MDNYLLWGKIFVVCAKRSLCCRTFNSVSGLYPVDGSNTLSPVVTKENISRHYVLSPLMGKIILIETTALDNESFVDRVVLYWQGFLTQGIVLEIWKMFKEYLNKWMNELVLFHFLVFIFNLRRYTFIYTSIAFAFFFNAYVCFPSYIVWFPYILSTHRMSGM